MRYGSQPDGQMICAKAQAQATPARSSTDTRFEFEDSFAQNFADDRFHTVQHSTYNVKSCCNPYVQCFLNIVELEQLALVQRTSF